MMGADGLRTILSDERGGVVVIFGIGLPVLAALVGSAVEYASLASRRAQLQGAVDAAAMAAVSQLRLANSSDSAVVSAAQATVEASAPAKNGASHSIEASVLDSRSSVRVRVEETIPSVMGRLMNLPSATLAVQATAKLVGVLISESASWRLRDRFSISRLDQVVLKGIGPATVFLLEGLRGQSGLAREFDGGALDTAVSIKGNMQQHS
jgi:Flp pilus assembly protein TadG